MLNLRTMTVIQRIGRIPVGDGSPPSRAPVYGIVRIPIGPRSPAVTGCIVRVSVRYSARAARSGEPSAAGKRAYSQNATER